MRELVEACVEGVLLGRSCPLSLQGPRRGLPLWSPHRLVSAPSPAWPAEEARRSSSEDDTDVDVDVGGLRRRRGREPSTPRPIAALGMEGQACGEGAGGELGISLNMCLVWALALLGLGSLLLLSGERHLPAEALRPPRPPPPRPGLTRPLCLHPQVASQSLTAVSGEGPRLVPAPPEGGPWGRFSAPEVGLLGCAVTTFPAVQGDP